MSKVAELTPEELKFYDPGAESSVLTLVGKYNDMVIARYQMSNSRAIYYPLTECCAASAKGCDGYIGCRSCYDEIDDIFASCWTEDQWKKVSA